MESCNACWSFPKASTSTMTSACSESNGNDCRRTFSRRSKRWSDLRSSHFVFCAERKSMLESDPMSASPEHPAPWWKRFALRWVKHRHTDNSAALAFYALFSVVPLLLLGVTVAAAMMGESAARGELHQQLTAAVGQEAALFLETTVESLRVA